MTQQENINKKQNPLERYLQPLRIRLLTLSRPSKQVAMIAADAFAYSVGSVVSFWIVYGTTQLSSAVLTVAIAAVVVSIPVHWAIGLYASIVRYMGLTLIAVGLKSHVRRYRDRYDNRRFHGDHELPRFASASSSGRSR